MKKLKGIVIVGLTILILLCCVGCQNKREDHNDDILTQKNSQGDRTQVTVLVKYAFAINNFEKIIEEKFPEIDLVQVGNYTPEMGKKEFESRLEHDDLTDIVFQWPVEIGKEYWSERLIDMSTMEITSRYNISMLNNIAEDGKLYFLPGPSQIRGIVYNKTLFEENDWQVPTNFEEFLSLCKEIESKGIRSIQLGLKNSEVLDTAFIGYNYGDYFSRLKDKEWMGNYYKGEGSFRDHFGGAIDNFDLMIKEGIWKKEDLSIDYSEREKMLFTRQSAMIEDSVLIARLANMQEVTKDEFAIMPFFNPGNDNDWARLYMVCYIGLNKHLEEEKNKEKFNLVLELLDYISTPEGQDVLASDVGTMFSSLVGAKLDNTQEISDIIHTLDHGRYAIFPQLSSNIRNNLAQFVAGEITKEELVSNIDSGVVSLETQETAVVYGQATKSFTMIETGNYVTDAMRDHAETEIAIFLDNGKDGTFNGKGISGKIYEGDVTKDDITRVLPDLKAGDEGVLWKIKMTGEDLIKTLEYSIPVNSNVIPWFYYFSGLTIEFNPLAQGGSRIKTISTTEGDPIENNRLYSIAVMDNSVPEDYCKEVEKTSDKIFDIVTKSIQEDKKISPENDRFLIELE